MDGRFRQSQLLVAFRFVLRLGLFDACPRPKAYEPTKSRGGRRRLNLEEGLSGEGPQPLKGHDARHRRVHPSLRAPCIGRRLQSNPPLRVTGQSGAPRQPGEIRTLLGVAPEFSPSPHEAAVVGQPTFISRHCGARMIVMEILARSAPIRAPPMRRDPT